MAVDSLIDINNIITGSNNIILKKVNARPYKYDKMYMDTDLMEDELYEVIDQFSERKINHRDLYFVLLDNVYTFRGRNNGWSTDMTG